MERERVPRGKESAQRTRKGIERFTYKQKYLGQFLSCASRGRRRIILRWTLCRWRQAPSTGETLFGSDNFFVLGSITILSRLIPNSPTHTLRLSLSPIDVNAFCATTKRISVLFVCSLRWENLNKFAVRFFCFGSERKKEKKSWKAENCFSSLNGHENPIIYLSQSTIEIYFFTFH